MACQQPLKLNLIPVWLLWHPPFDNHLSWGKGSSLHMKLHAMECGTMTYASAVMSIHACILGVSLHLIHTSCIKLSVFLSCRPWQWHCAWWPSVLHPSAIRVHHWPQTEVCSTLLWGPWTVGKPLQPHFWQVYLCHCTLQCWSGQHWNERHHQDWCEDSRDQRYLSLCEGRPWQLQC